MKVSRLGIPLLIAVLVAFLGWFVGCGIGNTQAASALSHQQWTEKARHHALNHCRFLGVKPPAWVRTTDELARLRRYVKRTWRRIAHPKRIVNARTWLPLLRHEGWPAAQIPTALMVIRRESGGDPKAWNRSTDCRGLFQIMRRYHPDCDLFNPVTNVRVALGMYRASGWRPWAVY